MSNSDPIDITLLTEGSDGKSSWTLPTWGNIHSSRVFLLATYHEGFVVPLGTGFSISSIGMCFTATHVIDEAFPANKTKSRIGIDPQYKSSLSAQSANEEPIGALAVLSIPMSGRGPVRFGIPEMISIVEPTDIGVVSYGRVVPEQTQTLWDALPISPMLPKIGSTVYCLGYCDFDHSHKLSLEELHSCDRNIFEDKVRANFRITKGTVTDIYTDKYANSYGSGPCFRISCALRHGQSGGPVINSDGYVCGINMSATLDSSDDSCLASLLSPALGGNLMLPESLAVRYKTPKNVRIIDLMINDYIKSDDSMRDFAFFERGDQNVFIPMETMVVRHRKRGIDLPSVLEDIDIPDRIVSEFKDSSSD